MKRSISKLSLRSCTTRNGNTTRDCLVIGLFYKKMQQQHKQVGRSLDPDWPGPASSPTGTGMSLSFRFLISNVEMIVIVPTSEICHEHQIS